MRSSGVGVQVHYIPVHLQPYYRKRFGHVAGDYPIAEKYYTETMTIPLHPSMTQHEIEHVIQTTKRHLRSPYC
jgi:dTDP-4-amino-4,6-dideoxygalactose transaminase